MENSVTIIRDGKKEECEIPEYGTIKIIIQNGKPELTEILKKKKLS